MQKKQVQHYSYFLSFFQCAMTHMANLRSTPYWWLSLQSITQATHHKPCCLFPLSELPPVHPHSSHHCSVPSHCSTPTFLRAYLLLLYTCTRWNAIHWLQKHSFSCSKFISLNCYFLLIQIIYHISLHAPTAQQLSALQCCRSKVTRSHLTYFKLIISHTH